MGIEERIPDLSDKELENLHANAVRLAETGTVAQRTQAETLLPLVTEALATRRVARTAAQQEQRRVTTEAKAAARKKAKAAT